MLTDSTQHQHNAALKPAGVLARAAERVKQFACGLHGHDPLLHFDHGRMSLKCASCGYESPGWEIKEAPAIANRERSDKQDAAQVPALRLVRPRRVA
jgi:hypothetical protein